MQKFQEKHLFHCDGVTTQRAGLDFKLCHVQSKRGGGESSFPFSIVQCPSRKLFLFLNKACLFCLERFSGSTISIISVTWSFSASQ